MKDANSIQLRPIGVVRAESEAVENVPSEGWPASLVLDPTLAPALEGLEVGHYIYVIGWFHKARQDVLLASPGTPQQRGVLSIRSSERPNALGLTLTHITRIKNTVIDVEWIDYSDGTPILDIKRYSYRWECVFGGARDDRTHFERLIPRKSLIAVLARQARNLHGELCPWPDQTARAGAALVQEHNVFLGDSELYIHVVGNGHLIDAWQGMTGASFGNGRLTVDYRPDSTTGYVSLTLGNTHWNLDIKINDFEIRKV